MNTSRRLVRDWLSSLSPDLGALYSQSILLLNDQASAGRTLLIAHCVREIMNRLPQLITQKKVERVQTEKHVKAMKNEWRQLQVDFGSDASAIDSNSFVSIPISLAKTIDEYLRQHDVNQVDRKELISEMVSITTRESASLGRQSIAQLWFDTTDWFVSKVHVGLSLRLPADEELAQNYGLFEDMLMSLLKGASLGLDDVREIVQQANNASTFSKQEVSSIMARLPRLSQKSVFYNELENPVLFPFLFDLGEFSEPFEPVLDERTSIRTTTHWPQGIYIAKCGKHHPDEATQVIFNCCKSTNHGVISNLIVLLISLPDADFIKGYNVIKKHWLKNNLARIVLEHIPGLMLKLISIKNDLAFSLFCEVFALQPGAPTINIGGIQRFEDPSFASFRRLSTKELDVPMRILLNFDAQRTLNLLCRFLKYAIKIKGGCTELYDGSLIWLPRLFHPARRIDSSIRTLAHTLEAAIIEAQSLNSVETLLQTLSEWHSPIFLRLKLHLLHNQGTKLHDLSTATLLTKEHFDCSDLRQEYITLLTSRFPDMTSEQQNLFYSYIDAGPRPQDDNENSEHYSMRVARWKRDRLAWIAEHLTSERRNQLESLVQQWGAAPKPVKFDDEVELEPLTSAVDEQAIQKMAPAELLAYLHTWKSSSELWDGESLQVLCAVLDKVVPARILEFLDIPEQVASLHPRILSRFLKSLSSAIESMPDDIEKTTSFIALIDNDLSTGKSSNGHCPFDLNDALENLLEIALRMIAYSKEMVTGHIDICFSVIKNALYRNAEKTQAISDWKKESPLLVLINSSVARRIRMILQYMRTISGRSDDSANSKIQRLLSLFKDWWKVQPKTEVEIAALAAELGVLIHLDASWSQTIQDQIFPERDEELFLFHFSFSVFCATHRAHIQFIDRLRGKYAHALATFFSRPFKSDQTPESDRQLARHIVTYGWLGQMPPNDELTKFFWSKFPIHLRATALRHAGEQLSASKEAAPDFVIKNLQEFWVYALAQADPSAEDVLELKSSFDLWFASAQLPDAWCLDQLEALLSPGLEFDFSQELVQRLAELYSNNEEQVLRILLKLIASPTEPWQLHIWYTDTMPILEAAFANSDDKRKKQAMQAVDNFLERGIDLRRLIPSDLPEELRWK